jgi:exodeoxyribonuclease VII small subunit
MKIQMPKKATFEESILRLKEIVDTLEKGETSLEESMKLFEEGSKLSASCYDTLKKAEQKISDISEKTSEGMVK